MEKKFKLKFIKEGDDVIKLMHEFAFSGITHVAYTYGDNLVITNLSDMKPYHLDNEFLVECLEHTRSKEDLGNVIKFKLKKNHHVE